MSVSVLSSTAMSVVPPKITTLELPQVVATFTELDDPLMLGIGHEDVVVAEVDRQAVITGQRRLRRRQITVRIRNLPPAALRTRPSLFSVNSSAPVIRSIALLRSTLPSKYGSPRLNADSVRV